MKINQAKWRLLKRKRYLEYQLKLNKVPEKAVAIVNAEIIAIDLAVKCMDLVVSYGFAALSKDLDFGGPLMRGQKGAPARS